MSTSGHHDSRRDIRDVVTKHMRQEYDFSQGKRGPILRSKGKTRVTMYLDNEVIEVFRAKGDELGRGYQTLINDTLKKCIED